MSHGSEAKEYVMFEAELAQIEEHRDAERFEKALEIAQTIFTRFGEFTLGQEEYRRAWDRANELTTDAVTLGDEIVRAVIVNDVSEDAEALGDKVWLMQVAHGFHTDFFLVSGRTEQDALDNYADNGAASGRTLDEGDMHDDDCMHLGNASERHFFEGLHLQAVTRASPHVPFVVEPDRRAAPSPR